MGEPDLCYRCGRSGHWSKECPRIFRERGLRDRVFSVPPPPPINFLRSMDRIIDGFRDYDYYDRREREDYAREMFERRYPPMLIPRSSRDLRESSRYMERPFPPNIGFSSSPREMFTRRGGRSPFGMYEDFSRDSFDDRRSGMRGMSPNHKRYAPY